MRQMFRRRVALVVGAAALAVAVGLAGIVVLDDADEVFAQVGGTDNDFEGPIEALPDSGTVGTWQVAGRTVTVTEATEIDLEGQTLAVGVIVEVEGRTQPDGSLVASEIEVEEDDLNDNDDDDDDDDDDD